ncbi:MAG: carboxymuconolactone decarboxylase family protein [Bacteroidetes bacterium]|nr:carboxymuconolactone decarboxylase family protein [Bacteroidota bacterium]
MTFFREAPEQAQAWLASIRNMEGASAMDPKTHQLVCIGICAALQMKDGASFHAQAAKAAGASKAEVISAILAALPAAGQGVVDVLPIAIRVFSEPG